MLLVDVELKTLRMPANLEDFEEQQDRHISDMVDTMRSDWVYKVYSMLENLLPSEQAQDYAELYAEAMQDGAGSELEMVRFPLLLWCPVSTPHPLFEA